MPTRTRRGRKRRDRPVTLPAFDGDSNRDVQAVTMLNPLRYVDEGGTIRNATIDVAKNVRESPLEEMHHRGTVSAAQKLAGDRFRELWELVAVQRSGAIDPSREPVDISGCSDPIPDRVIDAGKRLSKVAVELGKQDYAIVSSICGEGVTVLTMTQRWTGEQKPSGDARYYISRRLRDGLSELARFWGLG